MSDFSCVLVYVFAQASDWMFSMPCIVCLCLCQASVLEPCHVQNKGHQVRGSLKGKSSKKGSSLIGVKLVVSC